MRIRLYFIIILAFASLFAMPHTVIEEDGYYEVEHTWWCNGKQCSITLNISTNLYDYYQNEREHLAYRYQFNGGEIPPNYFSFMLSEHDREIMQALADEFSTHAVSELETINLALTFIQSLPYAYDTDSKGTDEYVRYPVETLVDGRGDCEDKVALLAALLYEMDVDFILLVLPEHMAVGVHCDGVEADRYLLFQDKKYYYVETTQSNWQIGQIPEDYYDAEMEAVPIDNTPSLLIKGVQFESQPTLLFEKALCEFEIDLHNLGPRKVTNLQLYIRIVNKGREDHLLAEEHYFLNDLQEGESRAERLSIKSLIRENCSLQIEVSGTEVTSQYFEVGLDYSRTRKFKD